MDNPWLEWWDGLQAEWAALQSELVLRQLVILGVVLAVALIVDRLLERYRLRWLGEPPTQYRLRAILWAAKFPALALLFGYLALSLYAASGRPADSLHKWVTTFWLILAYALIVKTVSVSMSPGDARRIIRRVLLPLLLVTGLLHLSGLLAVFWAWAQQPFAGLASGGVSPARIMLAVGLAVAFWFVAKGSKTLFLRRMLPRTQTDPNLARSVATFLQFAIVVLGLWIALVALGVSLSSLTLLVSALSVGIGFGLQDVIKNLIGGIILLGEGHVQPSEEIRVGSESGVVERIGLRSTLLRASDGSQVIVPNADLIADKIVDLTERSRVEVRVGVSCDADPRLAERLLLQIATAHPHVLEEPPPSVVFTNLGESTFDFILYCFVGDRTLITPTRSDLHYAVIETFRQHNLEIPYRQLDVRLH